MVIAMKGNNRGKPKSLPGTPAGKNKGGFQKKSLSPNSRPGGGGSGCHKCGQQGHFARECPKNPGGGASGGCHKCGEQGHFARECPKNPGGGASGGCHKCGEQGHFARECPKNPGGGTPGGCHKCGEVGHFARECPKSPGGGARNGKPFPKKDSPAGGKKLGNQGKPKQQDKESSPSPANQNGSAKKEFLKQLDKKSKAINKKKGGPVRQEMLVAKKNKNINRYHRFQERLNTKVRTPQACARALKAEQELTSTQGRILKVTLPDQVLTSEQVMGWSDSVESVLFAKPLQPRHFTIVLKAGVNVKQEIAKLSKSTVGNQKVTVKEQDTADLGHSGGQSKDPADFVDPHTLYITNLPDSMNKTELQEFFKNSTVSNPKKHNPKLGNPSKYAFVSFDTPEAALTALKENFNKNIDNKSIVMRFRRLNASDIRASEKKKMDEQKQTETEENVTLQAKSAATAKAGKAAQKVKKQDAKKQNPKAIQALKKEPAEDEDDDDDEDDEDEEMDLDQDDDDDSDEGGDGEEMDDDDDDDDDDEDDDEDDDDDDDE